MKRPTAADIGGTPKRANVDDLPTQEMEPLKPGKTCVLCNLKRTEFNGKVCELVGMVPESERWLVALWEDQKTFKVFPSKLTPVSSKDIGCAICSGGAPHIS